MTSTTMFTTTTRHDEMKKMPSSRLRSRANSDWKASWPRPGQANTDLDDDRAAEQAADLHAGHRHHRQQRIAQHVAQRDLLLGQALGARRRHVVQAALLQHGGAHQARVERHVEERERDGGQHQMPRDVDHALPALVEGGGVLHARCRQPVELDGEHHDQHQADPEQRHGVGDDGGDRDHVVLPGAHPDGGQQPEQYAAGNGEKSVVPISSSVGHSRARISGSTGLALRKE